MSETLTNRQIALIVFNAIVGYGIVGLPKHAAESAGTAAWIAIAISTAFAVLSMYIITYLGYAHPNMIMPDYSRILIGNFLTWVLSFIYILYYITLFTLILKNASENISHRIMLRTPVWVISFIFLVIALFAVTKKLRVVALVCEFYGAPIIIGLIIICVLLFTQGNIINMRPFFGSQDILTYFKASSALVLPFLGIETLLILPQSKQNGEKLFKYTTGIVFLIGLLYILVAESSISVRGAEIIVRYDDALIEVIRSVDFKLLEFLRRLDGVFIVLWIMTVFTTITVYFYSAVSLINKCFKKLNYNIIAVVVMIISFFGTMLPLTTEEVQKMLNYIGYFGMVTVVLIPLLLLIITKVKKYEKK